MEYKAELNKIIVFAKGEVIFTVSFILAAASCFFYLPKLEFINFKVLSVLFSLMIVINALKKYGVLEHLAEGILINFKEERKVSLVLISACFLSSMLITNDVSLLTFVPLTIITAKEAEINPLYTIILETIAANVGSSLTPFGNPQNLYLFSYFNIKPLEFFKVTGPFVIIGGILLILMNMKVSKKQLKFSLEHKKIDNVPIILMYGMFFILTILAVFNVINYFVPAAIIFLFALFNDKKLIYEVDYPLLATFVFFFIFIGNVSHIPYVNHIMKHLLIGKGHTYISSILFSQFISNVPCSVLLSGFTSRYKELLLGVNIGGMGTIIASLASIISYKFYKNEYGNRGYLKKFHLINLLFLLIFSVIFYFVL